VILILEGNNGTGKSTCAGILSEKLGVKVCRPFRFGDSNIHWGSNGKEQYERLVALKVPINTHVDDLYAAEFLSSYQMNAILDRPLTSAVAYGRAYNHDDGWYNQKGVCGKLLDFWMGMINMCPPPILYVWLEAEYGVARRRCGDRWCPSKKEYEKLTREYSKIFQYLKCAKLRLDTSDMRVENVVNKIMAFTIKNNK
jgi:deoxyadenosine/deoxycytidine kinase